METTEKKRICMLAAWGCYPVYVAEALKAQGYEVHCFGAVGMADEAALRKVCDVYLHARLGRLGKIIRYMRKQEIRDVISLGKVHKSKLFRPLAVLENFPDWTTFRAFATHFLTRKKDCRDDTLMMCMIRLFEKFGLKFGVPTDYAPELLVKDGVLTKLAPTEAQWRDIILGQKVAKELGRFDIGQSVTVANGVVLALEALEGTDLCIQRAGELYRRGGFVLVKMAKPFQDMRFDVPTIGMGTLEALQKAGGKVVAVEADRTVLVNQREVIRFADRHGMSIVAIKTPEEVENA